MRIVTWNVNGIKTLLQYHPWNIKRTYEGILEDLEGDITCIQETKITRDQLDHGMACMNAYDSFFSFYSRSKKGVHGTAIFTKRETTVPAKAEEGIGSALLPATMTGFERIGGYPLSSEVDMDYSTMKDLDAEGRTTVIDTGMFVLINLYCPNETNDLRLVFKNNFNKMVDKRVRGLIKAGREVIVVGDLNICASDLDTAEPEQRAKNQGLETFTDHPPRKWLQEFTGPGGPMIDVTRRFHPDRQGMFTCWNTKIDARPSNYGTRLDYILITPGLLPWVKDSDIQPKVVGSDHCPVYLDLHDEIEVEGRGTIRLWDMMNSGRSKEDPPPPPPGFATRFYDEFSGKQRQLSSWFGKKGRAPPPQPPTTSTSTSALSASPQTVSASAPEASTSSSQPPTSKLFSSSQLSASNYASTNGSSSKKGKGKAKEEEKTPAVEKKVEKKTGQQSLASFFRPPPSPEPLKKKRKKSASKSKTSSPPAASPPARSSSQPAPFTSTASPQSVSRATQDEDDDILILDDQEDLVASATASYSTAEVNAQAVSAWSAMLTPKSAPLCDGHNEPSKLLTVNKPGINKGRRFYLCARPVGPGYDKGKGQARINVNPEFRCDFFEWETNVRRPAGMVQSMNNKKRS
ncbi:hypothetical protein JCM1840_001328 [Sporobolomyces johnsonii]